MALITRGGGTGGVRLPAARMPHGAGPSGPFGPTPKPARPVKPPKPPKPPVRAPKPARTPARPAATTPAPGQSQPSDQLPDPFTFAQQLVGRQPTAEEIAGAQQLIDAIYAPQRQLIQAEIQQAQDMALARANQMRQVYGEFAQYLTGLASQWGSSADAKQQGFQDGAALAGGDPYGVSGRVAQIAQAASDAASTANQAWGTYMGKLPGIYSLMAEQNIKQMLNDATASTDKLRADLLSLSSKEAADVLNYLDQARAKDIQAEEWAYGQKSAQIGAQEKAAAITSAAEQKSQQQAAALHAKSVQWYMDYLQRQRQIDFNNELAREKMNVAKAKAVADANYKANVIALRKAGLISEQEYRAMLLNLNKQRLNLDKERTNLDKQRLDLQRQRQKQQQDRWNKQYQLDLRKQRLAEQKWVAAEQHHQETKANQKLGVQEKLGAARAAAAAWARFLATMTKTVRVSSGKTKGSLPKPVYNRRQVYRMVYNRYAPELFTYYQTLYAGRGGQGVYQRLVDGAIRMAVGWNQYGV